MFCLLEGKQGEQGQYFASRCCSEKLSSKILKKNWNEMNFLHFPYTFIYRRIPIITAPFIFGFSSPKGPLLSGGRYFRVAVTFGWLENVCNSAVVLHKEDT